MMIMGINPNKRNETISFRWIPLLFIYPVMFIFFSFLYLERPFLIPFSHFLAFGHSFKNLSTGQGKKLYCIIRFTASITLVIP